MQNDHVDFNSALKFECCPVGPASDVFSFLPDPKTPLLLIEEESASEEERESENVAGVPEPEEAKSSPKEENNKIRVMLADDHQMMREGLKKIVNTEDDLIVVGEASNGAEAVDLAKEIMPDVIIMDVNMPKMDGIMATQQIMTNIPGIRIVGLSLHDHQEVIDSMHNAGATAYLTKNEAFETLCATIRSQAQAEN